MSAPSLDDSREAYERDRWDAVCRGCMGDCEGCRKYGGPNDYEEEDEDDDDDEE